jgi:hypothetical protein
MNPKINASALKQMHGKHSDEIVSLRLRIFTPLTGAEISLVTSWGGKLLYDNGMMALLNLPVRKVNDIAEWETVLEII